MIKEIKIENKEQLIAILKDISIRAKNEFKDSTLFGYSSYESSIKTLIKVLEQSK